MGDEVQRERAPAGQECVRGGAADIPGEAAERKVPGNGRNEAEAGKKNIKPD